MDRGTGRFIVFEGIEGAGKSTQIDTLAAELRAGGRHVCVTREPGGSPLGVELRRLAMDFRDPAPAPLTELLLYLADRAQHLADIVRPALDDGDIVLCDRFSASTIVYQGVARGLDVELVTRLDALVRGRTRPDMTVLLDCPVGVGLARARGGDRFHEEDRAFHERVRQGFRWLAERDRDRHLVVDATAPAEEVAQQIHAGVLACLAG